MAVCCMTIHVQYVHMTLIFTVMRSHLYSLYPFLSAELTWEYLITKESWDDYGDNSIATLIAKHDDPICDRFACKLLKALLLDVNAIRREAQGNNQFIQTVLGKWHSGEGNAVPFTWRDLIQCMKGAGLETRLVHVIEGKVLGKFVLDPVVITNNNVITYNIWNPSPFFMVLFPQVLHNDSQTSILAVLLRVIVIVFQP